MISNSLFILIIVLSLLVLVIESQFSVGQATVKAK